MSSEVKAQVQLSLEQEELRAVSGTLVQIHGVLIAVVALYLALSGAREDDPAAWYGLLAYAALTLVLRGAARHGRESRWKIAVESWVMIAFLTWLLHRGGGPESPLFNAYLLPAVLVGLTLGGAATITALALIGACALYLTGGLSFGTALTSIRAGELTAQIAPMLLAAYVTNRYSAEIRYGISRAGLDDARDPLTGLYQRRSFAISAHRLFARALRHRRPSSLLMLDCDGLGAINAAHGVPTGDQVLRRISESILGELRVGDVAGRCSEDQFIVLLPETPLAAAVGVAERIRASAAAGLAHVDGLPLGASASLGCAASPEDGHSLDELAARAERALRRAKQEGGNRVCRVEAEAAAVPEAAAQPAAAS